ncbi:DNase I-like protein [Conidiobolus coronatus NRRL 28638]|uniref:DNase I-like protein n=1 Tax=Conidiobolus coronatus (strain ATCC 28846 / CBS 209.66 / NRRL 28638) TaxID=796925 RepID=A0A137P6C0_CONC2|nr:DNase I-like protein [Conidiobolus coronatus NRRL 28638]|eukprot:KXN70560.1 DNase I-like protein [Conidiobolus coronatus NRRL 28638]
MKTNNQLNIIACTFNVHKEQDHPKELYSWIEPQFLNFGMNDLPDLIAVGYEEFLGLKDALLGGNQKYVQQVGLALQQKINSFTETLPSEGKNEINTDYTLLSGTGFGSNALFIFSRDKTLTKSVVSVLPVGLGSGIFWVGNKGAISVSIRLNSPSSSESSTSSVQQPSEYFINFICAHLDANKTDSSMRNFQLMDFAKRLEFTHPGMDKIMLSNHDTVVILGDLNYRVNASDDSELVEGHPEDYIQLDEQIQYNEENDQLHQHRTTFPFLGWFREATITFPPTYKYIVNSSKIDYTRTPSWCDRVLVAVRPPNEELAEEMKSDDNTPYHPLHFKDYQSVQSIQLSDHRPVYCHFVVDLISSSQTNPIFEFELDPYRDWKQVVGTVAGAGAGAGLVALGYWYIAPAALMVYSLTTLFNFRS